MSIVLQGSTSGSCTLQEQAVAGTTVLTLPTTSGTVLTDTSPKAGNVIQVVSATFATQTDSSAANWVDTGLTVSITPTSSSSKILVIASLPLRNGSTSGTNARTTVFRGSTNLGDASFGFGILKTDSVATHAIMTMNYLDSPATTSSTAYKVSIQTGGQTCQWCGGSSVAVITVMEIAA
jgi:hypothetical protein